MAMTPDRLAAVTNQLGELLKVHSQKRRLIYTVRPSASILGKSIEEMRKLSFWVGHHGVGQEFNLDELIVIFTAIFDTLDAVEAAMKKDKNIRNFTFSPLLNLEPTDDVINNIIQKITFSFLN